MRPSTSTEARETLCNTARMQAALWSKIGDVRPMITRPIIEVATRPEGRYGKREKRG